MKQGTTPDSAGVPPRPIGIFLKIWWRFFWRYALLWGALLLGGGWLLNRLSAVVADPGALFRLTLVYSGMVNALASLLVFGYILNRPFKKSSLILSTRKDLPVRSTKWKSWFCYYWRFVVLSFILALCFGGILPVLAQGLGRDPLTALQYSKYVGNLAMIPASWLAFRLLLARKGEKSLLQIHHRNHCLPSKG